MNAHSSEHPIPDERSTARMSRALSQTLPGKPDMRAAMEGVLRERRRRGVRAPRPGSEAEAVEAEVISALYGDAASRHRAFDTQPSRVWPVKPKAAGHIDPDPKSR